MRLTVGVTGVARSPSTALPPFALTLTPAGEKRSASPCGALRATPLWTSNAGWSAPIAREMASRAAVGTAPQPLCAGAGAAGVGAAA